jgi:hypothetical protein
MGAVGGAAGQGRTGAPPAMRAKGRELHHPHGTGITCGATVTRVAVERSNQEAGEGGRAGSNTE